jgi:hypothetical protein
LRPLADGHDREGATLLASALLVLEMWVAVQYLGALMVITLIIIMLGVLYWGSAAPRSQAEALERRTRSERVALVLVLIGVATSFGLYEGFKNRPGAYQGSPSFLMDPSQQGSGFRLDRVRVPGGPVHAAASGDMLEAAFTGYGRTLQRMLAGYHILDRNYTWDFHNELFLRSTPLLPNYRTAGLQKIAEAQALRVEADRAAATARASLDSNDPLAALLDDVQAYVAFNFDRAARIEKMSADFEKTQAGLQHAAHIYEGEGKLLGTVLADVLAKHRATLDTPEARLATGTFVSDARAIYAAYADRVVGF